MLERIRALLGSEGTTLDASCVEHELRLRGQTPDDYRERENEWLALVSAAISEGVRTVHSALARHTPEGWLGEDDWDIIEYRLDNGRLLDAILEWVRAVDGVLAPTSETPLLARAQWALMSVTLDTLDDQLDWWTRAYRAYDAAAARGVQPEVSELIADGDLEAAERLVGGNHEG